MCATMNTTEFTQPYVQYMYMLTTLFATSYCRHTAEMAVVEPIWQLHTLIVMNSWYNKGPSLGAS